jgi:signal transduction histidine kinase
MTSDLDQRPPQVVILFSVGAVAAFLLAGVGVTVFMVRTVTGRAEEVASFHAKFVTDAVLAPALRGIPLDRPLSGAALENLHAIVSHRILDDGRDVRVKLWNPDGTVLYSDYAPHIGRSFPEEQPELREAFSGEIVNGIADLTPGENVGERHVADKLFQSYVPVRLDPAGPVVAVAELYQDYSALQGDIDSLVRTLTLTFAAGLVVLFALLLPIALRASRALRAQNRRLREQADQLSDLLAREQRTVSELRDLNQRKNDFVATASHELRTPLTAIMGYLRTLRRPEFADDAAMREEFLEAMEHQSSRLHRSIKGLLMSARLEEPEQTALELSPIDVREVAADAVEQLQLNGRCRIDMPPGLPRMMTDQERLRDVLVELLDNAVKYSPDGGPIEISAAHEGNRCALSIHDQGVGMDPAVSKHVFERFYQADQSATRAVGGLGLGLHLVSGIVRELGGTVSVKSEIGVGSTFTVVLPQVRQA